jgi:hypothetical protein
MAHTGRMTEAHSDSALSETEETISAKYEAALLRASKLLSSRGMNSKFFREANDAAGKLHERLREFRGKLG